MRTRRDPLADTCRKAFAFLCERYRFAPPVYERIGRETYVRYHRGDQTVSIAWEPDGRPIVELFYPAAETGERPVPWAEKNGIARAIRIPAQQVPLRFSLKDPAPYFDALAQQVEKVERGWLSG